MDKSEKNREHERIYVYAKYQVEYEHRNTLSSDVNFSLLCNLKLVWDQMDLLLVTDVVGKSREYLRLQKHLQLWY
jgi:hypothetical protein